MKWVVLIAVFIFLFGAAIGKTLDGSERASCYVALQTRNQEIFALKTELEAWKALSYGNSTNTR